MRHQRGVSLGGLVIVLFLLIVGAMLGFKLFTPYSQYFTIQRIFQQVAAIPEVKSGNRKDAMNAWARYAIVENINTIGGDDIEVTKEGNNVILSASYSVKVPLFHNISLLIDFNPTSAKSQ
jgi:Domain of unknown function (DUF4845)